MQIYLFRSICLTLLILSFSVLGDDRQAPALDAGDPGTCHISDPMPLLDQSRYRDAKYQVKTLKKHPMTIEEKIVTKTFDLTIVQQGCEDIQGTFIFSFKNDPSRDRNDGFIKASTALKRLHLAKDFSLIHRRVIQDIAKGIVDITLRKSPPERVPVHCLQQVEGKCIADISLESNLPNLTIRYIDRP